MAKDSKSQAGMKDAIESILSQGVDEIEKNVNKLYEETRYSIEYVNTGSEKIINDYIKKLDALEEEIAEYEDELNDIYEESSDPTKVKDIVEGEGESGLGLIELVITFDRNNKEIEKIVEEQSHYEEGSEKWELLEKARKELVAKNEEITEMIDSAKAKLRELGVTNDMYDEILTIGQAEYILSKEADGYEALIENAKKMEDDSVKAVSENPIVINILRYMARLLRANITFVGGSETVISDDNKQESVQTQPAQEAQPEGPKPE